MQTIISVQAKLEVVRRKHIVHPTGFDAYSSTCCKGITVPAPWESISSHPRSGCRQHPKHKSIHNKQILSTSGIGQPVSEKGRPPQAIPSPHQQGCTFHNKNRSCTIFVSAPAAIILPWRYNQLGWHRTDRWFQKPEILLCICHI